MVFLQRFHSGAALRCSEGGTVRSALKVPLPRALLGKRHGIPRVSNECDSLTEAEQPPVQVQRAWLAGLLCSKKRLAIASLTTVAAILTLLAAHTALTWPHVGALAGRNPQTTAFIESYRAKAEEHGGSAEVLWVWVSYDSISPHLKRAVLVAEDIGFFSHGGFEVGEIKQAIRDALGGERSLRGASTITQQLAKNLWLSPSRSLVRKLKEAALAYQLEHQLSKKRIVAGELGGRVILVPRRPSLRATSDRVREAWFSALGTCLEGAVVVDLFAGSGALGIEALSRGAKRVDFVEADRRLVGALQSNLKKLGVSERGRVCRQDAFAFLDERSGRRWDVALADPPYRKGLASRLADRFRVGPFADLLCVEHEPGALVGDYAVSWSRRYGDVELTFLTVGADGSERETDP